MLRLQNTLFPLELNNLAMPRKPRKMENTPTREETQAALERLTAWSGLAGSKRLKGVLAYLCEEVLEDRGDAIRAKTIALDHYGYSVEELADRESVVRVDIGRLRRRLEEYYQGPGIDDPLRISLSKESYTPEISYKSEAATSGFLPAASKRRTLALAVVALLAIAAIASIEIGFFRESFKNTDSLVQDDRDMLERSAVFDVSPLRLQAMNLAEGGRNLVFPAVQPARVKAALATFEAAIETDPTYFGGHAGKAQTLAILAFLTTDSHEAKSTLTAAEAASKLALELSPDEPWSQSARAWLHFLSAEYESALELSARAVSLAPNDPHIVEFDALIALFSGEFDRVVVETERMLKTLERDSGFVFTSALGSAKFHMGDDEATIDAFEDSIRRGGPVGPFTLSYMMAAHYRLGQLAEARELAQKFAEGWPDHRMDLLVGRLFADPKYAAELVQAMRDAGWSE